MNAVLDSERLASLQAVLAHWNMPSVTAIEAIQARHPAFKISTLGPTFLLKDISHAPNLSRLEFTRAVLTHVARSGLKVPVPIPARSAHSAVQRDGRYYLLSEFIPAGERPSDLERMGELFYQTGQAIGVLHTALAAYPEAEARRQTWREDLAGHVGGWMTNLCAGLPERQAAVVRKVSVERDGSIEAALRGLPEQLIHRDCHPGNILVDGTRVVGFIDCDHLCIGPRLFDLAYYAVHHLKWQTEDEAATSLWLANLPRLLQGYRAQRSLPPAEAAALPPAMLAYHLLLAHWFLGRRQMEDIELELRALAWIHTNFDRILIQSSSEETHESHRL
jgi:Ser/Thr protein kinase RdoA (MazF antagonist)